MRETGRTYFSKAGHLSDWQLAWLAGFIDGEGSIGIYRRKDGSTIQLKVNNTCLKVIDFIHTLTGVGNVTYSSNIKRGTLPQKSWLVSDTHEMQDIVVGLLPYLLIKTSQATMMLEYCNGRISGSPLHDDLYYYKKTMELNHSTKKEEKGE